VVPFSQFPAACFLKLSDAPRGSATKLPAWACAGFGLLVMVLSAVLSITKAFRGGGERLVCT
jgi:sodium-coupled neutral amino acid transporter 11